MSGAFPSILHQDIVEMVGAAQLAAIEDQVVEAAGHQVGGGLQARGLLLKFGGGQQTAQIGVPLDFIHRIPPSFEDF